MRRLGPSGEYGESPDLPYPGVRGWLLFLCVVLTVISPLATFISCMTGYDDVSPYLGQFPGLRLLVLVDAVLSLGLMVFSVYAGTGLWSIRPGAVQTAKRYLLFCLVYAAVAAVLPFMVGLPSTANGAMFGQGVKTIVGSFAYCAIWYSYLSKSKRVRATYPLNGGDSWNWKHLVAGPDSGSVQAESSQPGTESPSANEADDELPAPIEAGRGSGGKIMTKWQKTVVSLALVAFIVAGVWGVGRYMGYYELTYRTRAIDLVVMFIVWLMIAVVAAVLVWLLKPNKA